MGDETLGEIDANRVGERIAAAITAARMSAIIGVLAFLALLGGLAWNDSELVADMNEAQTLGEDAARLGARLLVLADRADALVRDHGVSDLEGWTPETGRSYRALNDGVARALADAPDLAGPALTRFEEVARDVEAMVSRTKDALIVAALGYPDDARLWVTSPAHRSLRTRIGGKVRTATHAARALGEKRVAEIGTRRRVTAFAGGAVGLLVLMATVGWMLRRSENAVRDAGQELARRAEFCPLTGLPNRSGFEALLAERVAAGTPFALVSIDLDGFKPINDIYGQAAGDRVLQRVALRLGRFFGGGAQGTLYAARLGGDEFASFVPLVRGDPGRLAREGRAMALASDLRAVISANVPLGEQAARFGASLGVACFPDHASDAAGLQDASDLALQRAKESEEGVCLYDPAFDEERRAFTAQKMEVARALSADEFEPFLQPVVTLADGSVASFEMLARWRRGDRVVSPGLFLPAIEAAGLLDPLTLVLLGKVLDEAASWERPVPVSVNMAATQLRNPGFVERLGALLDRADEMGVRIEVELLEESVFSDSAATKLGLDALRARGVRLALDDFGVGYSNFAQLGRVAIDKIKIDRSFVMEMDKAASAAVVRAAIDISDAIGVGTVAEGIEDAGTARRLHAMGCTLGQGYHFARPMPARDAARLLVASTRRPGERPASERRVSARSIPLRQVV